MFSSIDFRLLLILIAVANAVDTHTHPPEYSPKAIGRQHQPQASSKALPQASQQQAPPQRTQPQAQPKPRSNIQPGQPQQTPPQQQQQQQQQQGPLRQHKQQEPVPTQFGSPPQRPQPQGYLQPQILQQPSPPQNKPGITAALPISEGSPVSSGPFPALAGMVREDGRRVDDIRVACEKTHMTVTFKFSAAFSGYIYPQGHFTDCLLMRGHNSREERLTLRHGTCGDQENFIVHHGKSYLDPIIEHRLMVQWEPDIVCEDDSSVIVRCDRPDDFNKTVEWRLETRHLLATLENSQHPGPKMWMEIQRGEGPTAAALGNELVYIGDVLTLIFTLSDDTYWFDSNVIVCYAVDGGEEQRQIQWDTSDDKQVSARARLYSGEATVIEEGCSVKPKVFSHFIKEKHTRNSGDLVTLHYAYFKAFRFPTSHKLVLQCNVQVCYKECPQPRPCSEAFHPRVLEEQRRRRRREAETAAEGGAHEVDEVNLRRSIEVQLLEEGGAEKIPYTVGELQETIEACYSAAVFYTVIIALVCLLVLLVAIVCTYCLKDNLQRHSFFTPTKQSN